MPLISPLNLRPDGLLLGHLSPGVPIGWLRPAPRLAMKSSSWAGPVPRHDGPSTTGGPETVHPPRQGMESPWLLITIPAGYRRRSTRAAPFGTAPAPQGLLPEQPGDSIP